MKSSTACSWVLQLLLLSMSAPTLLASDTANETTKAEEDPERKHNSGNYKYCEDYRRRRAQGLEDRDYAPGGKTPIYDLVEKIDDSNIEIAVDLWLNNRTAAIERFGFIQNWDVLGVTSMRNLFRDATTFNSNIVGWDVDCVTNFHGMFWGASAFNQDISNWNVGSATNMHRMFEDAVSFNQDLPWSAPNNEDMAYMFSGATSFQGDVSAFDTSSVVSMERTFSGINYNPDITNWNVENVFTMASMFEDNTAFNSNITFWKTPSLQIFDRMFFDAASFDQSLCWKDLPYQEITSTAVFCETEGSFDKRCVAGSVIDNSKRRCISGIDSYIQSWTDFFEDVAEFFQNCFGFITGS